MQTHSVTTRTFTILRWMLIPILLIGIIGYASQPAYASGTVIYVKWDASGANNGTSWADAYTDLQSALLSAPPAGTQIWVAAGTYYPESDPSDPPTELEKSSTFQLLNGVEIYGGFDGTETTIEERDPEVNVTVLSGDIGVPSDIEDNIFHVVTGSDTNSTAVLDGFTITAGNAANDPSELNGGGILNVSGSPTISHMIISGNNAIFGGGMFNHINSSPTVTNVTFTGNTAQRAGGMYNNLNSNSIVTNVTFANNIASIRGGGMTTSDSSPTLTNVTFYGNEADKGGALHNAFDGNPTLINVTFSGNTATEVGGGIYSEYSAPVVINSILYNNTAGSQPEIFSANGTTTVSDSIVEGGYPGTGNLDQDPLLGPLQDNGGFTQTMALGAGSPAIEAGDDDSCPATDQRGVTRPRGPHCDMGAYEFEDNDPPDTTIVSFPSDPDDDATPTFSFSGSDVGGSGVASFMCQMDSGGFSPCTSPFTSAVLAPGSHVFEVYAIDLHMNADPTPASYTWLLDYTPTDVVSIVRADTNHSSATSVDFTVTFSETVTGVDTGDFSLTTTGISGSSITNVSGTDKAYTVTVNTGTGNGYIRLDVSASADMEDPFGNAPTNLPFTSGETYTILKDATFTDVPTTHTAWSWIERLYLAGITGGCGSNNYCPGNSVTREQMAVFLLRGKYGSSYTPPPATGVFSDVNTVSFFAPFIEQMEAEGITGGCSTNPLKYCPTRAVTREQMAIFLLRAKYGSSYTPPPATGMFGDVPTTSFSAPFIEQLADEGITGGCGGGNYCPTNPVTRAQMAIFLVRTFNLP